MLSRHSVRTHQGNELTCNSSGNAMPQSSQLVEPLGTDPGLKGGTGVRELICTLKKKKKKKQQQKKRKAHAEIYCKKSKIFPKSPRTRGKSRLHQHCQKMGTEFPDGAADILQSLLVDLLLVCRPACCTRTLHDLSTVQTKPQTVQTGRYKPAHSVSPVGS